METVIAVLVIVGLVVTCALTTFFYLKGKTLDDIRADVYKLILMAEHHFTEEGSGKDKMEWVLEATLEILPAWARLFITKESLAKAVQLWFDAVKDLLDDGKVNMSSKE
jgi:hypothetical protein